MQTFFTGCGHALRRRRNFSHAPPRRERSRFAVAACALVLAGCAPEYGDHGYTDADSAVAAPKKPAARRIPAPSQALLAPERKPDCEADPAITNKAQNPPTRVAKRDDASTHSSEVSDAQRPAAPRQPGGDADLALRIKLEYERECYKQAEVRVRTRLQRLQAWTAEAIKAPTR